MSNKKEQSILGSAPVGALMRQYALPCIISLVVGSLYNIVDQLFIANTSYLGSYGNAANSTVFPLVVFCLALAGMFGDGTNTYFTFCAGAGKYEEGKRSVGTAVVSVFLLGVGIMGVYLLFGDPLLAAFGASVNETTFINAKEYLFWLALGLPFYMLGQSLAPIICGDGSPRYAMVSMVIGSVINIILDPIFLYVFEWGMKGAAIATILGQIASCLINVLYLRKMKTVKLSADCFIIRGASLKRVVSLGITSFLSQISIVISMAALINVINYYGASDPVFGQEQYAHIPLAVVGIVFKFFQIVSSVAIGLGAGCLSIVSYNHGAGKNERLLELLSKLLKAEIIVGVIAFIIYEGFARPLTFLFGAAGESVYYQTYSVSCIRIFLSMVVLSCMNRAIIIFLQGLGEVIKSTTVSVVREFVGGVGFPVLLGMVFGFKGILYFLPCAEIVTFIVALSFILHERACLKSTLPQTKAQGTYVGKEAVAQS